MSAATLTRENATYKTSNIQSSSEKMRAFVTHKEINIKKLQTFWDILKTIRQLAVTEFLTKAWRTDLCVEIYFKLPSSKLNKTGWHIHQTWNVKRGNIYVTPVHICIIFLLLSGSSWVICTFINYSRELLKKLTVTSAILKQFLTIYSKFNILKLIWDAR